MIMKIRDTQLLLHHLEKKKYDRAGALVELNGVVDRGGHALAQPNRSGSHGSIEAATQVVLHQRRVQVEHVGLEVAGEFQTLQDIVGVVQGGGLEDT